VVLTSIERDRQMNREIYREKNKKLLTWLLTNNENHHQIQSIFIV